MQTYNFIMNINDLYKPALKQEQQPFYQEWLSEFTDNQLDELWEYTIENHCKNSPPSIGELKKYAASVTPVKVISEQEKKKLQLSKLTDEEIFSTELGRLSLVQGWADSYRVVCKQSGIPEQSTQKILEFQRGKYEADAELEKLNKSNAFDIALINLRKSMHTKNAYWHNKYSYLIG